ncbi:MAG: hypothetical protein ACREAL_02595 [Nitrosopumilaceae archaeon]
MDIKIKAFQIIYDVIGIVLRWDKNQLSDKEAMKEIVEILASQADNDEFNNIKKKKKFNSFQKKLVAPLAIGAVFSVILFVAVIPLGVFTNIEPHLPTKDNKIGFEQLEENQYDITEKIQNNTTIEEFSNITNFIEVESKD